MSKMCVRGTNCERTRFTHIKLLNGKVEKFDIINIIAPVVVHWKNNNSYNSVLVDNNIIIII